MLFHNSNIANGMLAKQFLSVYEGLRYYSENCVPAVPSAISQVVIVELSSITATVIFQAKPCSLKLADHFRIVYTAFFSLVEKGKAL